MATFPRGENLGSAAAVFPASQVYTAVGVNIVAQVYTVDVGPGLATPRGVQWVQGDPMRGVHGLTRGSHGGPMGSIQGIPEFHQPKNMF